MVGGIGVSGNTCFLEVIIQCLLANYSNEQVAQIALIENTCRGSIKPNSY